MIQTNRLAREAITKLKEATELCSKLQQENEQLHQMIDDVFAHMKKLRELERESILTPTLN